MRLRRSILHTSDQFHLTSNYSSALSSPRGCESDWHVSLGGMEAYGNKYADKEYLQSLETFISNFFDSISEQYFHPKNHISDNGNDNNNN